MTKPWQDLVTHRLLLRAEAGGGGGGGGRLQARWHTPDDPAVVRFGIDAAGIHLVQ